MGLVITYNTRFITSDLAGKIAVNVGESFDIAFRMTGWVRMALVAASQNSPTPALNC